MYLPNHRNVYEKHLTCQCQINGLPSKWLGGFKGYSGHQADLASEASTSTSTSLQHGNHSPGVAPVAIPLSKSSFRKGGMDPWWIHPGKLHSVSHLHVQRLFTFDSLVAHFAPQPVWLWLLPYLLLLPFPHHILFNIFSP